MIDVIQTALLVGVFLLLWEQYVRTQSLRRRWRDFRKQCRRWRQRRGQ